jgi:hypothetical protein
MFPDSPTVYDARLAEFAERRAVAAGSRLAVGAHVPGSGPVGRPSLAARTRLAFAPLLAWSRMRLQGVSDLPMPRPNP